MASSLSTQLSRIAATSTRQLDLKAQRFRHSESLIFDKKVAGAQDFDTIYQICLEGYQELCALDHRFTAFQRTIFSEQSKSEDRGQMTAAQNKELDAVLESFLALIGSRLLLKPAMKAVDWLIRRFRVHEHNTSFLILTFLPYHAAPIFLNLLSILPQDVSSTFKFLYPYKRSLTQPPRHAVVHSATTNTSFFAALNDYVLQTSKAHCQYQGLVSFWAGITTEALAAMLDSAKSGRLEIERRNKEDILLRIIPVLNDAFVVKDAPQLIIASFMICVVLANKASLENHVLDSLMEAVVGSWTQDTMPSGFTCLSVLAQRKDDEAVPAKVVKSIIRIPNAVDMLEDVAGRYSGGKLVLFLVKGSLTRFKKSRDESYLVFVDKVIHRGFLDENTAREVIGMLLQTAESMHKENGIGDEIRPLLADTFLRLSESTTLSPLLQGSIKTAEVDLPALEMSLETVIANHLLESDSARDVVMKDEVEPAPAEDTFMASLESLSEQAMDAESFLSAAASPSFDLLARQFIHAGADTEKLGLFSDLPILRRKEALEKPRYISFFVRFFSGPYPTSARAIAVMALTSFLHDIHHKDIDLQALIPYSISLLMDPSERLRREGASLLAEIDNKCSKPKGSDETDDNPRGLDRIYDSDDPIQSLQARQTHKIVRRALLPAVEECVLDAGHMRDALATLLRGSGDSEADMKKSLRHDLFVFLCSHAVASPIYSVKLRLLSILNKLEKIGSTSRTQALLPLLKYWQHLSMEDKKLVGDREHLSLKELEDQVFCIVTPKDPDAFDILLSCAAGEKGDVHSTFRDAAFDRLKAIWASFKEDREVAAADNLLEASLADADKNANFANHCRGVLRNVDLSGAVLTSFINKIFGSVSGLESHGPARKKRRTSESKIVNLNPNDAQAMDGAIRRMTYILELIDGSKPEEHPELVKSLMQTLAAVHQLKLRAHSEMSYLLSLILGMLLSIVNKAKATRAPKLDVSTVRADLIIDCVRASESPQVQNTALLLVAGLATIAPEMVLHSVMPIFTFMGSNVLKKDDAYSSLVIDQTIDQVVPPLIQSLRKQKRDIVSSTSDLLLSFTAAFEHIPSYRRHRLFETLISKLGTVDFLFAVFAMLANKYAMDKDVMLLMTSLASNTDAETQLRTYSRYLDLVRDTLQPKPQLSRTLLGIGSEGGRDPQSVAVDLLQALSHLLKYTSLASKMSEFFDSGADESSDVHTLFSGILEKILKLSENARDIKPLSKACGGTLGTFLGTLSLVDFIDTVEVLLGRPDDDLRRKVLKLTENRLDSSQGKDSASRTRALEFSSVLVDILQTSSDILLKHAAVACIEKISEKYGKKDPQKVIASAKAVASGECLGQSDDRIRVMGMLCLASMTEVLGEGVIPVLPDALPRLFDLLQSSLWASDEKPALHDACYSFISALLIHVPWMVSGTHLDNILQLSFKSATQELSAASDGNRHGALQLLAKRVDVKETFASVERNWSSAVSEGPKAVREALNVIKTAIGKHPKSSTAKNVPVLMKTLRNAFDLRRTQLTGKADTKFDVDGIDEAEALVNDVTIGMIYKLNDTIFRPLFIELTDWAVKGVGKSDKQGRLARMTAFYKFLETFFGTLKSIVTGYSTYVLESAAEVLQTAKSTDNNTKTLWLATVRMLRHSFEHDQDEFWQSPSHLTSIAFPLVNQLSHARNSSTVSQITSELVPTIVELAAAADSPDNHKELNAEIMKFMRAGNAAGGDNGDAPGDNPYTRLAAVKCEQALTERLGEEWLALLPEMLPYISELMEDDDENVEKEVRKWVLAIEDVLGEKLDDMLM